MRVASLVLIGALAVGGYVQGQPPLPEPPKPPAPPWAQKEPSSPACLDDVQRLCSGKQGQEAAECLKSNADKLSGKCKPATPK